MVINKHGQKAYSWLSGQGWLTQSYIQRKRRVSRDCVLGSREEGEFTADGRSASAESG